MSSTLPEPPAETPDHAAEYQRLYDLVCGQGDALARLTEENRAVKDLLVLLGARPPAPRRHRAEASGLRVVR